MRYLSKWVRGGLRYVNHEVRREDEVKTGPGTEQESLDVLAEFWSGIFAKEHFDEEAA